MIHLESESVIPLSQAAKLIPPTKGKRRHTSTVFRWALSGVKNSAGDRVKLDAVRLGHSWFTSHEALQRFAEALTGTPDVALTSIRTQSQRERAAEKAGKELAKYGI